MYAFWSRANESMSYLKVGCPRNNKKSFLVRTKTNGNKICFGCDLVCFVKLKQKISVCLGVSNLCQNNQNKQNRFKTNQNTANFSEKYPNMISIKLFRLVFCLFQFNRNIKTLCFGIEAKQPKQTVSKQTKTNPDNPKLSEQIPNYQTKTNQNKPKQP